MTGCQMSAGEQPEMSIAHSFSRTAGAYCRRRGSVLLLMVIRRFKLVSLAALATLGAAGVFTAMHLSASHAASSAAACTRLASSSGSDSAAGTPAAPWRTLAKLTSSLQPGDVGCLAAGQTFGSPGVQNSLAPSGVTLQSAPGTPATIVGLFAISGDNDTVTGLTLDGHNTLVVDGNPATAEGQAGVFIAGDNDTVRGNDISNGHTAICMEVGIQTVSGAVIDGNRIHACGILPKTGLEHGIYVDTARGTQITNNVIYDIADYGIQVYPDAQDTLVQANVIDTTGRGGVIIGSEGGPPSGGTTVTRNIITNSAGPAVSTYWGGSVGSGNVASDNCTAGNAAQQTYAGLTVSGEKTVSSAGLDGSYLLSSGSACLGYGPAQIQPGSSAPPTPPSTTPTTPPKSSPPKGGGSAPTSGPSRGGVATAPPSTTPTITSPAAAAGAPVGTVLASLVQSVPARTLKAKRTFTYTIRWAGNAARAYQVRIDKRRWLRVKGLSHTFTGLHAGKHTVHVRPKGTTGKGITHSFVIR